MIGLELGTLKINGSTWKSNVQKSKWRLKRKRLLDRLRTRYSQADDPKYKKLEYAIFLDQKIEVNQVAKLYVEVLKQLFELQPETFFTTDLGERISLTKNPNEKGLRQPVPINDTYFIEGNIDNTGKFDRIMKALTIFDLEDELSIKYTETT
ncbi:MAG: hypothetical protein R6V10_01680 [bacterium]